MGCSASQQPKVSAAESPPKSKEEQQKDDPGEFSSCRSQNSVNSVCSFGSLISQNEHYQLYEYKFGEEIGRGSMSRVYKVTNTETGEIMASKVYLKKQILKMQFGAKSHEIRVLQDEIQINAKIFHKHIIPINEYIDDDSSGSFCMIMPFAPLGNLENYCKNNEIEINLLKICFHQMLDAIGYLHSIFIAHRDIKPSNILVFTETNFALSDMSASAEFKSIDEDALDTKGSPAYLSPEECSGDPFSPFISDIWSLGLSIFKCVFGFLPFKLEEVKGATCINIIYNVSNNLKQYELEIPENCSEDLRDLLTRMIDKDPHERISLKDILKHKWFDGIDYSQYEPPYDEKWN